MLNDSFGYDYNDDYDYDYDYNYNLPFLEIQETLENYDLREKHRFEPNIDKNYESNIINQQPTSKFTRQKIFFIKKEIKLNEKNKDRKLNRDNYSYILFKEIFSFYSQKIQKQISSMISNKKEKENIKKNKLYPPDYDVFTHNSNLFDIRFFLDIAFKYILQMTKPDKESIDQLLIMKKIKKLQNRKNGTELNTKEYNDAIIFLNKFLDDEEFGKEHIKSPDKLKDYINRLKLELNNSETLDVNEEIEEGNKNIIKSLLIEFLKIKGIKNNNEDELFKKDKEHLNQIYVKSEIKMSYDLQLKNKKFFEEREKIKKLNESDMKLRQIIMLFLKEFNEFDEKIKDIEKYIESIKKYIKNGDINKCSEKIKEINNSFETIKKFIEEEDLKEFNEKLKEINIIFNSIINKDINEFIEKDIDKYYEQISKCIKKINFYKFKEKIKDIDEHHEKILKYSFSKIYGNACGFIRYVESYTEKKSKDIQNLIEDLNNKNIKFNEKDIKHYIEKYINKKHEH